MTDSVTILPRAGDLVVITSAEWITDNPQLQDDYVGQRVAIDRVDTNDYTVRVVLPDLDPNLNRDSLTSWVRFGDVKYVTAGGRHLQLAVNGQVMTDELNTAVSDDDSTTAG